MCAESIAEHAPPSTRAWNRVPEILIYFWVIKILCTTVGETAADYLIENVGFGITRTMWLMIVVLVVALGAQFSRRRYVAAPYWAAVVLISIVGTLITDNLTDNMDVSLWTSTIGFSIALIATFIAWHAVEGTLSIHTVYTSRREAFYWLAVLFTFALGTAGGDLIAEDGGVGFGMAAILFGALIAVVWVAHRFMGLGPIVAFWIAYVLTRPLGASIGDLLSQGTADGGLGLGTTGTSILFLVTILGLVGYLTLTNVDRTERDPLDA